MRILKKVLILVLVCILPLSVASACAPKTCTITFVQAGQENIVKTIEKGSDLTDIPTPVTITGYDVVWDVTDFTNIQQDMTVTAVATLKTYTITFVQDGQDNIVKTAQHGTDLTDIPTPATVTGYDVVWNVTDFTNIQQNMTVTAVPTGKIFSITYVISDFAEGKGVTLSQPTLTVVYDQAFTLEYPTYTFEGVEYILSAWLYDGVEFTNGTWTLLESITLTMAHFEPVNSQGEWIS